MTPSCGNFRQMFSPRLTQSIVGKTSLRMISYQLNENHFTYNRKNCYSGQKQVP